MPRSLAFVLTAALALWAPVAHAQVVEDVFPVEPKDGDTQGPRPTLTVGVEGSDLGKMRFKIEMSRDDFETIHYSFDQKEAPAGWVFNALGSEKGAIYRAPKPVEDGLYRWRVAAWNGIEWVRGKNSRRVRIDGVPPADVEGLQLSVAPGKTGVQLNWSPVSTDRNGGPEYVTRYRVYRYDRRSFFFVIRPFEIGETEDTSFVDTSTRALDTPMLFYMVTAEDAAGNEPDRRY